MKLTGNLQNITKEDGIMFFSLNIQMGVMPLTNLILLCMKEIFLKEFLLMDSGLYAPENFSGKILVFFNRKKI